MKAEAKIYKAALYMRLSKDDIGVNESASISTQRNMLRAYAGEHGYAVYDEYVDDGWSGTNFERPAWKRMLGDIESKRVNLVITKDLSRLGRDYITAGQYTEIYFPSKGVRYIAINDGYDSDSPYTDIAPFKNVINEMYARDTSKKIRSAFQTKMQAGAYIGNFAPYGYMKDPDNKNHLLIDHAAAPIVQEMFRMAEDGAPPSEIASIFNARKIATPAVYRCTRHPYLNADGYSQRKEWTSAMICKMLRNIVYLGHIAQGKTTKVSFKSRITLQNPRDAWIIVPNMHEPLISQDTYDNVRKRSISRRITPNRNFSNIFSGIAKCADCGRNMSITGGRRKGGSYNLVCGRYKQYGSSECSSHLISYETLYQVVIQELKRFLPLSEAEKKEIMEVLQKVSAKEKQTEEGNGMMKALQRREQELDRIIEHLYEDNVSGKLDESRFYKLLSKYETEQKDISSYRASLVVKTEQSQKGLDKGEVCRKFFSLLSETEGEKELAPELLRKLVERIEVCQGIYDKGERGGHKRQTIRIYYRFIGQS